MSIRSHESIKRWDATPATHHRGVRKSGGNKRPALSERSADQTNSLFGQCGTKTASSCVISSMTASRPKFIETVMQALLELATYFKANQCALFLLEHGASAIVPSDEKRKSSLAISFKTKNVDLINRFFQQTDETGFENAFNKILESRSYSNTIEQVLASPLLQDTISIFSSALGKAIKENDTVLMSKFLAFPRLGDRALLEKLDESAKSKLLFLALSENRPEISRCLIEAGVNLLERNEKSHTPLLHAIATGQQEIACLLVDNFIQKYSNTMAIGIGTLEYAFNCQQDAVTNHILEKASLRENFSKEIENFLLKNESKIFDILSKTTGEENSAIASAFMHACLKNKYKAEIIRRNWQVFLSGVAKKEKSAIVTQLFSAFALPAINQSGKLLVDEDDTSPLMYAIDNGHVEATRLLINAGVDLFHKNFSGNTALLIAIQKNNPEIAGLLIEKRNPIDLSKPTRKYALHVLTEAIQNSLEITRKLLERLPQDPPAAEPTNTPLVHPLERRPREDDPFTVLEFLVQALEAGKPSIKDVFALFQFALGQSETGSERNDTIALALARHIRTHHRQFSGDTSSDLDEELDVQNNPEFARYLKAVDGFVARRESASNLVSTLRRVLSSAGEKVIS